MLAHEAAQPVLVDLPRPERVDQHRDGVGDADGVGELHLHAVGQTGRHAVLRDVAGHVRRGAVDLGRVLARKRAAAVGRHAAVGVDDDLPAGQAGVAVRAAGDEAPGRVHVDAGGLVEQRLRHGGADHLAGDVLAQLLGRDPIAVLARHHHGVDAPRPVRVVLHGDLRLAVGAQIVQAPLAADVRQRPHEVVRQHERQRHQLRRLVAGVPEHQPLVARAAGVDPHRDVGRLPVQRREHGARVGVEAELRAGVPHVPHGLPGDVGELDPGRRGDLPRQHDESGREQRLAGHAPRRVFRQDGVEDRVRDLVGNLVRMALGDRFGREEVAACPAHGR